MEILLDSYDVANGTGYDFVYISTPVITVKDCILERCALEMGGFQAPGNLYAQIFYRGEDNKPTGIPLATSDVLSAYGISDSAFYNFTFSGINKIRIDHSRSYSLVWYNDSGATPFLSYQIPTPANPLHPKSFTSTDGKTWTERAWSIQFNLYGTTIPIKNITRPLTPKEIEEQLKKEEDIKLKVKKTIKTK